MTIHPTGGRVHSGANLLISGLCRRPGAEIRCDFGELGTVAGRIVNDTKAICSVPLTTTSKEVTLFVYSIDGVNLKMAQVLLIGKVNSWPAIWLIFEQLIDVILKIRQNARLNNCTSHI